MLEIPGTLSFEVNTESWQVSLRSRHASLIFYHREAPFTARPPQTRETPLTTGQLDQSGQRYAKLIRPIYKRRSTFIDHHRNFYDTQPANYKNELSSMGPGTDFHLFHIRIGSMNMVYHPIDDRIVSNLSNRGPITVDRIKSDNAHCITE